MTPLEMAMKLASASATCEQNKCPGRGQCKGGYSTCMMKEVALMLRSQQADIDSLQEMVKAYQHVIDALHTYIVGVEKINKRYHDICVAFNNGYRPKRGKVKKLKRAPRMKKKTDPVEMDGDERYAYEPPKTSEPAHPLVVI